MLILYVLNLELSKLLTHKKKIMKKLLLLIVITLSISCNEDFEEGNPISNTTWKGDGLTVQFGSIDGLIVETDSSYWEGVYHYYDTKTVQLYRAAAGEEVNFPLIYSGKIRDDGKLELKNNKSSHTLTKQ